MKKKDAITYYGSQKAISDALHISEQAVSQWPEIVPEASALKLERLTRRKLNYGENDYR